MLLVSVPINLAAIFYIRVYKARQLQGAARQKEEDISE